ncbi:MAG: DUF2252 domain-containing protein [Proteobacteria bacterium]|nr:MAG: DUF2252 domain-containing protein [Pseudomonadota bacterium]
MRIKHLSIAFTAVVLALGSGAAEAANTCSDLFAVVPAAPEVRLYEASQTLSQRVRDNAPDYWHFGRTNGSKYFGSELKTTGLVVGDAHPGNFVLAPLNEQLQFYFSDLKDVGDAPVFLDFARLVISTQAIMRRVEERPKLKDLTTILYEAYISGLNGRKLPTPSWLESTFNQSIDAFEAAEDRYIDKKTAYKRFRWEEDAIAPLESDKTLTPAAVSALKANIDTAVRTISPNAYILDYAVRPRERGGSRDLTRYWALVQIDEDVSIVEFKRIGTAATESYTPQGELKARYKKAMHTFWNAEDPKLKIVSLQLQQFLMRPKKVELFSVPYSPETAEEQQNLIELAAYDANHLGRLHAKQFDPEPFIDLLEDNEKSIKKSLRKFTKDYLQRMIDLQEIQGQRR